MILSMCIVGNQMDNYIQKINAPETSSSNDKAPVSEYESDKIRLQFRRDLLTQNKAAYSH